jgi:hypothetical protein
MAKILLFETENPIDPFVFGGNFQGILVGVVDFLKNKFIKRHNCRSKSWSELVTSILVDRNKGHNWGAHREKTDAPEGLEEEGSPPKSAHLLHVYIAESLEELFVPGHQI